MLRKRIAASVIGSANENEGASIPRRTFVGGALAVLLSSSVRVKADNEHGPNDPFIVLLRGFYQPVPIGQGPAGNLGLTTVDLSDGSFSKTQIYPVWGVDGADNQKKCSTLSPDLCLMTYRPHILASSRIPGRSVKTMKCCASWRQWAPWHCSFGTLRKTLQPRESVFRRCLNFIGSSRMRHNGKYLTFRG
jgi:hypothetical protein